MSWGRIDDGLHDHEKFMAFGPVTTPREAWLMTFSWTQKNYRRFDAPGFVPTGVLVGFAGSKQTAEQLGRQLVEARLWEPAEGGWAFHDWLDYAGPDPRAHFGVADEPAGSSGDPGRVETLRDKRRRAGRDGGRASAAARRQAAEANPKHMLQHPEAHASAPRSKPEAHASAPEPVAKQSASQSEAHASPPEPAPEAHARSTRSKPEARASFASPGRPAALAGATDELVAEYAARYTHTLPRKLRQQLFTQVDQLLGENFTSEQIRAGLALLHQRPGAGPGLLPNLVHEAAAGPPAGQPAGKPPTRPPSAAARRKAGLDALRRELAEAGAAGRQASVFPFVVDGETA